MSDTSDSRGAALPQFGGWLREQVTDRLMTFEQFAAASGLSATAVRNWMSGRELPSRLSRAKLAKALGVPRAEIDERVATESRVGAA